MPILTLLKCGFVRFTTTIEPVVAEWPLYLAGYNASAAEQILAIMFR